MEIASVARHASEGGYPAVPVRQCVALTRNDEIGCEHQVSKFAALCGTRHPKYICRREHAAYYPSL
jgi:hypothetical protein